jgi:hypothetical protein
MSLDFILVKYQSPPNSLSELEADESFGREQYRALAENFFESIRWQSDGTGNTNKDGVFVELHPSDASLSLWCRGDGDIVALVNAVALAAHRSGVVVIDVQSSELVVPESPLTDPAYVEWYRNVLANAGG